MHNETEGGGMLCQRVFIPDVYWRKKKTQSLEQLKMAAFKHVWNISWHTAAGN